MNKLILIPNLGYKILLHHIINLVRLEISSCKALQAHNPISYNNVVFLHPKWRLFLLIYAPCLQSALPPPSKGYRIPVGVKRRMRSQKRKFVGIKNRTFKYTEIYWPTLKASRTYRFSRFKDFEASNNNGIKLYCLTWCCKLHIYFT